MGARRKPVQAYVLKVTLRGIRPPIWRRFAARADTPLPELHTILQAVMGWWDYHLHSFRLLNEEFGVPDRDFPDDMLDERAFTLARMIGPGHHMTYTYDFGDDWEHRLVVEKAVPASEFEHLPVCLKGRRSCPPEDCGGPWGYERYLKAIGDPDDEEHEQMIEWRGEGFDPEAFDLDAVNKVLRALLE